MSIGRLGQTPLRRYKREVRWSKANNWFYRGAHQKIRWKSMIFWCGTPNRSVLMVGSHLGQTHCGYLIRGTVREAPLTEVPCFLYVDVTDGCFKRSMCIQQHPQHPRWGLLVWPRVWGSNYGYAHIHILKSSPNSNAYSDTGNFGDAYGTRQKVVT